MSVIAGGNASGKSTVLFAAACAYRVPGAGVKDFVPSTLFPDYRPRHGAREDEKREVIVEFDYTTPAGRRSMRWRRAKGWSRSFLVSVGAVIDGLVCALIGGVPGTVPGRRRGDGNGSVRLIGESVAGSGLDENALAA